METRRRKLIFPPFRPFYCILFYKCVSNNKNAEDPLENFVSDFPFPKKKKKHKKFFVSDCREFFRDFTQKEDRRNVKSERKLSKAFDPAASIMGSANTFSPQGKQPLFSFGVISDVQHADIPDGHSFLGVPRYYRHSILVLERAIQKWNYHKKHKFIINFGDIVDGFCPQDQSLNTVRKVVEEFEKFDGPVYHMIGNHCLYNLPRNKLLPMLKIPSDDGHAYYDFSPTPEYRFVVLDGYDISAIGWPEDHPNTLAAVRFLQEKNPNIDKNSPKGLVGLERRFLKFNGAVGEEQLKWLDDILQEATQMRQNVVICCHLPLDPGASSKEALLWNYDKVMNLIHRYSCVKICLAGHDHKGGHSIDSHGVHHRVLEAALECPPGTDAFGYVDVYNDRLSLVGTDRMESSEMCFNPQADL